MTETENDPIFNNNPLYMKSLVGKQVEIKTLDKKIHSGIVYVIDPIFKTIVLHTNWISQDNYKTVMILYHAIQSLEVLSEEVNEKYLIEPSLELEISVMDKKEIIKKWLKHMMIDVKESGDYLKIDDYLVIMPPYNPENCICNSTIVSEKIQKILKMMPENFS